MAKQVFNITINVAGDWIWCYAPCIPSKYTVIVTQLCQGVEDMANAQKPKAGKPSPAHHRPKPGGNGVPSGGQGTFAAQLMNNGVPIEAVAPWVWASTSDITTITPSPDDPTGGTVIVTVSAEGASTGPPMFDLSAETQDPTGATVGDTLTVPITPGVAIYTVSVTQVA